MQPKVELVCPKATRQRKKGKTYKYCKIEYAKWMRCEIASPWIAVSGKNWVLLASLNTFYDPDELEQMRIAMIRIRQYMEDYIYGNKTNEVENCLKQLKEMTG